MIYVFRFEHSRDRLPEEGRKRIWEELRAGKLRQGWGRSGMSLVDRAGVPLDEDDWVPRYISAAKKHGWGRQRERKARTRHRLLSHMLEIRAGDIIAVANLSETGRNGLVLVRATRRSGSVDSAECYGWDDSPRNKLKGDYRHFITVDPFSMQSVAYDKGIPKGRLATRIRSNVRGLRFCVFPLTGKKHNKAIRDIEDLYRGKVGLPRATKRKLARTFGGGHPPTRDQIARGQQAEDEMLKRLKRGVYGLTFVKDCRNLNCGYDFLCREERGDEIEVETKGFATPGQLVVSENEFRRAKHSKSRYWLIGLLDGGGTPRWNMRRLADPAAQIERIGSIEKTWHLRLDPSQLTWDD